MSSSARRLGLSLAPTKALPIDEVIRLAVLADSLGYDSVWIPETWGFDAASLLAVLTVRTERIRVAAGVFNVFSRSAALIAQTAATLQALSGGRFLLGLGTSGPRVVERWHGLPYREPLARTRDYVEIIRRALAHEPVDIETPRFHLRGFTLTAPPQPPVPIYIAALGPRNVQLTGEIADGWLPIFAVRGLMRPLFETLHAGAERAGRDPATIDVAAFIPAAMGPRGQLLLRQVLAYYVGGMGTYYLDFMRRLGLEEEAGRIREEWERGNRSGAVRAVTDEMLGLCTLGDAPDTAAERLQAYRAEGIQLPVVSIPHGATPGEAEGTIRALASVETRV